MPQHRVSRRDVLRGLGAGSIGLAATDSASAHTDSPDRYIVGVASERDARAARAAADAVTRVLDFGQIGQAVSGRFSTEALDRLRARPGVRYVEADGEMHAIGQTLSWGIDRVDADVLHDDGYTGTGADIAIIDTGIDDDHPDLQANVGSGRSFVSCRGPNCNHNWSDDNDHGTHCAGIADGIDNTQGVVGVSTQATLHAIKVLDKRGSGSFSDVAAGITYTADQGWDVGSLSLGASSGSSTVKDACQYASDNDVLLVAAAGNDGPCTDCVGYPAAYDTVMAISSTDEDDSSSSFSSTGSEVELAAPGRSIYSTVIDGYATFSGTSMACPHVAGAGGMLVANGYSNAEARQQLTDTAEDIGLTSTESGAGLLDAEAAIAGSDGGTDASPSVSWVNPVGGDTVSGTVTVQIDAADSEDSDDSLDATYAVDGGSNRATAYNATTGYYENDWDTSGVADGDHTLTGSATDSAGNSTTANISVTTDNATGGDTSPTVDAYSVTEAGSPNPHCEITADWAVGDTDGDLATVVVEVTDSNGAVVDSTTTSVSGSDASGTDQFAIKRVDGQTFDVTLEVSDTNANTATATDTVTE